MVRNKRTRNKPNVASSSAPPPPWIELPRDVTANILIRLGIVEILESAQKVCTTWRSVCKDPHMWRVIDLRKPEEVWIFEADGEGYQLTEAFDVEIMCRHAVDRSQGQLVDLNIENFNSDEFLLYISERSSQLKRLRLASCRMITGEGLSKVVEKFPHLSELHLFFIPASGPHIEVIGRACPLLKAFSLNDRGNKSTLIKENNEHALAVANNMPGLHHLRLFGNNMNNKGLEAILVGCLQLESLDIRQCFFVDLSDQAGDLGKRCARQIRELRAPNDSVDDYEFDATVYHYEVDDDDDAYVDVYDYDEEVMPL